MFFMFSKFCFLLVLSVFRFLVLNYNHAFNLVRFWRFVSALIWLSGLRSAMLISQKQITSLWSASRMFSVAGKQNSFQPIVEIPPGFLYLWSHKHNMLCIFRVVFRPPCRPGPHRRDQHNCFSSFAASIAATTTTIGMIMVIPALPKPIQPAAGHIQDRQIDLAESGHLCRTAPCSLEWHIWSPRPVPPSSAISVIAATLSRAVAIR